MTTHLYDIVDETELRAMLDGGFVREKDLGSLRILNYAEKAQYEKHWNPTTLACRGLIYDSTDGTVLARPWGKFFNYGEHPETTLPLDGPVEVTDKLDGSLGILYFHPDGYPAISTRGSMRSEQALHATDLYLRRYHGTWQRDPDLTYLFEIIYPANRIVLDYGDLDDLVLLGAVETATGRTLGPNDLPEWPGPRTCVYPYATLREALEAEPRPNAEGLVIRFPGDDLLVKLKQEDYVALHRIVTGLNERAVWERLGAGENDASICQDLPDEFHDWVRVVAARLVAQQSLILAAALTEYAAVVEEVGTTSRRTFAERAVRSEHRALLFGFLDGKNVDRIIWKGIKPAAGNYARPAAVEEVAA